MAPGRGSHVPSPAPASVLPKASFRKVEGEDVNEPTGVADPTCRSYGYNDFSYFSRPSHYIRFVEPLENDLNNQVEYDMDEQDQEWLDMVNEERKKAQVGAVPSEVFEILMDKLEKEWFELMKHVPKHDTSLPSEDSTCAVCDDGEGENSNAIVFCDGCNLAVHQDCYGVPYIPEGQWLCRKCTVSPEIPVECLLCPNEGGAFKQTSTGQWAHLLCAMFIPEVSVGNMMFMEPIDNIDKVPKSRWKLTCSLCRIKYGACIQCDKSSCFTAFHVTCARRAKLLMGMKGLSGEETAFKGYCEKHLPEDVKQTRGEVDDTFEGPLTIQARTPKSAKTARAYAKKFSLGPPLVPQVIVDRLENYYKKHFRQKTQFIHLVCKYWSLKREARRGAPLLKRLHLEPWSASSATKQTSDEEKTQKLEYLLQLRKNLESVKQLTALARQREEHKLNQAKVLRGVITSLIFPHAAALKHALDQIQNLDKNQIFRRPVTRAEAPDYYDIIKNPMCFMEIENKIEKGDYLDLESFKADLNLVFDNAMVYNKRDTVFYKTASRLKTASVGIWAPLVDLRLMPHASSNEQEEETDPLNGVGDLEASNDILQTLLSEESIANDTDLILETDPITSLFRCELAKHKLPPPPPPPPSLPSPPKPKRRKEKPKRDYKAERERRKQVQAASAVQPPIALEAIPDFRAPRTTRRTKAALEAIEAEIAAEANRASQTTDYSTPGLEGQHLTPNERGPKVEQVLVADLEAQSVRAGKESEQQAQEGSQAPAHAPKPRSAKREPRAIILPGQGAPNMVESVDNHDSFKNFDRGWILPSGLKRRGRAVPESPQSESPPRKRPRTERAKSRLSIVTPAPSNNVPSESMPPESVASQIVEQSVSEDNKMDLDQHASFYQSRQTSTPDIPISETPVEDRKPEVTPAAEVPDESHKRKRSDSVQEPTFMMDQSETPSYPESAQTTASKSRSHKKGANKATHNTHVKSRGSGPLRGAISLKEGDILPGGTLVWAKMESYPWWAAVVWEEDSKEVPPNVLKTKETTPRTEPGPLTLVQFYDKSKSWQWLELSNLRLLGEDQELDTDLLSGRVKYQVFRTSRLKQLCRAAYRDAMAEMEGPDDSRRESLEGSAEPPASTTSGMPPDDGMVIDGALPPHEDQSGAQHHASPQNQDDAADTSKLESSPTGKGLHSAFSSELSDLDQ
ncbi:hypothetical protein M422DRAFT_23890 [Sphaerobolus stellatus SS14]|nr:hypothetical protein M422DRAFT_23890 [Sphaerobolus stellatus SS14]